MEDPKLLSLIEHDRLDMTAWSIDAYIDIEQIDCPSPKYELESKTTKTLKA